MICLSNINFINAGIQSDENLEKCKKAREQLTQEIRCELISWFLLKYQKDPINTEKYETLARFHKCDTKKIIDSFEAINRLSSLERKNKDFNNLTDEEFEALLRAKWVVIKRDAEIRTLKEKSGLTPPEIVNLVDETLSEIDQKN